MLVLVLVLGVGVGVGVVTAVVGVVIRREEITSTAPFLPGKCNVFFLSYLLYCGRYNRNSCVGICVTVANFCELVHC